MHSACGRLTGALISLRSGDALTLVRWWPPLRWQEWTGDVDGTTGLTLPAGRSALALFTRPGSQPGGLKDPCTPILARRALLIITASPQGEEEANPEGEKRGTVAVPVP